MLSIRITTLRIKRFSFYDSSRLCFLDKFLHLFQIQFNRLFLNFTSIGWFLDLAREQCFIIFWITKYTTKSAFQMVNLTVPYFTIFTSLVLINSLYLNLNSDSLSTSYLYIYCNVWCSQCSVLSEPFSLLLTCEGGLQWLSLPKEQ